MSSIDLLDAELDQPCIGWSDLRLVGSPSTAKGWSERLPPGVTLLLDVSGDYAARWLPVIAGRVPAQSGRWDCQSLEGAQPVDNEPHARTVFWQNPREPLSRSEQTAQEWGAETAQRWPQWNEVAWQRHVQGFALAPQLNKPLWHLSTGSLRKLWMAAALASGAPITLLDEPIAGLDGSAIRYLGAALDALGEELALAPETQRPRWILVAHWEALAGVTWDSVVELPNPDA